MLHEHLPQEDIKYRHELKYLITSNDAALLKQRLGALIARDENAGETGVYKVRSLYFDDYWNSAYEEKMMGIASRSKYRIRVYDDSDRAINLERKLKQATYVSKQTASLTRSQLQSILGGDYRCLLDDPQPLCKEFYYECTTHLLRPRVIVDYDREPYVFLPGDVRITFDMDVRAALLSYDLFDPHLPALGILEPNQMILEVKFTEFLPSLFKKVLPQRQSQMLAVSKFILACDRSAFLSSHLD